MMDYKIKLIGNNMTLVKTISLVFAGILLVSSQAQAANLVKADVVKHEQAFNLAKLNVSMLVNDLSVKTNSATDAAKNLLANETSRTAKAKSIKTVSLIAD